MGVKLYISRPSRWDPYRISLEPIDHERAYFVDEQTLEGWLATERAYWKMQCELKDLRTKGRGND